MYSTMYRSREKDWGKIGLGCLGLLALVAILVVVSAFVITLVWGWIVPQIFPSAVEQGVLPSSLTIVQALKLSILFSILGLTGASSSRSTKHTYDNFGVAFIIIMSIWAILVVISGFFISIVWNWVIPDVFSGAVAMNLLPANLSLWHAILLSLLLSVLGLSGYRARSS